MDLLWPRLPQPPYVCGLPPAASSGAAAGCRGVRLEVGHPGFLGHVLGRAPDLFPFLLPLNAASTWATAPTAPQPSLQGFVESGSQDLVDDDRWLFRPVFGPPGHACVRAWGFGGRYIAGHSLFGDNEGALGCACWWR